MTPVPSPAITERTAAPAVCRQDSLNVDYAPYWITGWWDHGTLDFLPTQPGDVALNAPVVAAEVISEGGSFTAHASPFVYPDGEVFTSYAIRAFMVLGGNPRVGDMPVAIEGGTVGCVKLTVDVAPKLEVGARYVLFLATQVADDPVTLKVFEAWPIDANGMVRTPGGPMSPVDLAARIARLQASASPSPAGGSSARP